MHTTITRSAAALLLSLAALPAWTAPGRADTLWRDGNSGYFSDHKAHQTGDLLTVIIVEDASGSNQASSQTTKQNKFSSDGGPGVGLFKFLHAFSGDAQSKNDFTGSGQAGVSSKLTARLTAKVLKVEPNGNMVIQGQRTVGVNHDQEELTLTATVRPEDVKSDNTVLSTYLADAAIGYHGHGPNAQAQHQGLISRFLNWIF